MAYLIGTDEAGYGPNLGPLVVSATVWRVGSVEDTDLYARLRKAVRPPTEDCSQQGQLVIGDSKALYKPGTGIGQLERGVLTFLAAIDTCPDSWKSMWESVATEDVSQLSGLPWYRDYDAAIPVDLDEDPRLGADQLMLHCRKAGCVPEAIRSRTVFPPQFNQLVDRYGNKASALSRTTLELVRSALDAIPRDEPVYVLCDKHGGRNKYGPLLNETFPDVLAMVRKEGREESVYELGSGNRGRKFVFRAKGEGFLPSALASMVSKYLRELAMQAFNQFWAAQVRDLKPTAGYPVDAKRFKQQISPAQKKLGIEDRVLWRCR